MPMISRCSSTAAAVLLAAVLAVSAAPQVDETPAAPGEWGFRPAEGETTEVTPPGFCWRPQKNAAVYDLQCASTEDFQPVLYAAEDIEWNVHCPPQTFPAGRLHWRFRYRTREGDVSEWSRTRSFTVAEDARDLPLPGKTALLARIPEAHPRLFLRPEQVDDLRERARTDLKSRYDNLVAECEKLLANPPPTQEPPTYPKGMKRGSDEWRKIWWGNRTYTQRALDGAATLAFTRLLGGNDAYGQLAKRILMDCAEWNPKGATGYRYNDEAGMPYAYYFCRTYTFLNDMLSEEEKAVCRQVMSVRGDEMYRHLCPRHLWRPYASHSNRAWHFLGEIGIAFNNEIPEAGQWAWFAANVFANVYPVWSDADGGWHEGSAYWSSYISRFTWWADIMRAAMDINAYDKPYFSQIGYYPMYLQPPGTQGGGFGDLTAHIHSGRHRGLMTILAAQAENPYWQWYVEQIGGSALGGGYVGFVRGALPKVEPKPPLDLPTSRCFHGTGQAFLNTTLLDADRNVEVIFKSSPFGTQSHGYESQNSFLLYAYGERLFIRTGRRDSYGSKHHREWMWQTKSTNCITVNGEGQKAHSATAVGAITRFHTAPRFDYVVGEAAPAYTGRLEQFTRRILFCKPDAVVIHDTVVAPEPSTFQWLLHAPVEMTVNTQSDIRVVNGKAACQAAMLWPPDMTVTQTDRFDPPPRPRIKLVEYHLTAEPPGKTRQQEFVTVFRPHRATDQLAGQPEIQSTQNGFALTIPVADGRLHVALNRTPGTSVTLGAIETSAETAAWLVRPDGTLADRFAAGAGAVETRGQ